MNTEVAYRSFGNYDSNITTATNKVGSFGSVIKSVSLSAMILVSSSAVVSLTPATTVHRPTVIYSNSEEYNPRTTVYTNNEIGEEMEAVLMKNNERPQTVKVQLKNEGYSKNKLTFHEDDSWEEDDFKLADTFVNRVRVKANVHVQGYSPNTLDFRDEV